MKNLKLDFKCLRQPQISRLLSKLLAEWREHLRELNASGFAAEPMAEGTGPQELNDVVGELCQQHYSRLVRHARRHIRQRASTAATQRRGTRAVGKAQSHVALQPAAVSLMVFNEVAMNTPNLTTAAWCWPAHNAASAIA
jgi:hypothetical protein